MRAPSTICFAVSVILLSACGRSSNDVQTAPAVPRAVEISPQPEPRQIVQAPVVPRSLGQPRLSRLTPNTSAFQPDDDINLRNGSRPPAATFSRYDGRLPDDATVPSDISVARRAPTAPSVPTPPKQPQENRRTPSRDIVDVGLNRTISPTRSAARAPTPTRVTAINRAPAPKPRPIAATPTPVQRPQAEVSIVQPQRVPPLPAPVLPPRPSIAALQVPGLSAPAAIGDTAPTGLPVLRSVEQAVPLGTLPASLGVANIEVGEAALPQPDQLEQSVADDSGTLSWTQAASLIRAGEVESATDIGQFEVLLSLCSGRGVVTIQPTPTALADLEKPKVVCGKSVTLTSQ